MSEGTRFCHKCGAPLPAGAVFCPKCGTPLPSGAAPPSAGPERYPPSAPMRAREEKHEKQEKQEKHEKHEKGRGGDLAGAITGGLILIFLGVLLYYASLGTSAVTFGNFWEYFLVGIGVIFVVQGIVRYGEKGVPYFGSFIGGAVMIIVGLAFITSGSLNLWPLILVVLGAAAIISAFTSRRHNPRP